LTMGLASRRMVRRYQSRVFPVMTKISVVFALSIAACSIRFFTQYALGQTNNENQDLTIDFVWVGGLPISGGDPTAPEMKNFIEQVEINPTLSITDDRAQLSQ
jgi:hypothetical protein